MRAPAVLLIFSLATASCADESGGGADCAAFSKDPDSSRSICVRDPWVRPAAQGARATAGYMTISVTSSVFDLLGADAPGFDAVELHRTTEADGMMRMEPVPQLTIPADGSVSFEPGGYHIMLIGPQGPLAEGDSVEITLNFDVGGPLIVTAPVERRGAGHGGH